jgi:hypothetical protein
MIRRICPLCAGNNIESQDSQLVISPQLYSSNFTTDFYGFQVNTHQVKIRLTLFFPAVFLIGIRIQKGKNGRQIKE